MTQLQQDYIRFREHNEITNSLLNYFYKDINSQMKTKISFELCWQLIQQYCFDNRKLFLQRYDSLLNIDMLFSKDGKLIKYLD
mgnify:CR=1 FL=1